MGVPNKANRKNITVVGAGVIGITTALYLQRAGHSVTVLDRVGVAAEASKANAGAFAFTDIIPLATPGIMRKAPRWLLDPQGPLSVPPAYAPKLLPWLLHFWRASWRDRYDASVAVQAELMQVSRDELEALIKDVKAEHLIQRDGQLQLFESKAEFDQSLAGWAVRKSHGIRFDFLDSPEAIADIQPGLSPRFTHAVFTPDWLNTSDPASWVEHLAAAFIKLGGMITIAEVTGIQSISDAVSLETSEGEICSDNVVLCAGAWSHYLSRGLGDKLPLETERGYNTTLSEGAFDVKTHLTFGGHGFVVTRINGGVRVGGAVELGGLNRAPNYMRSKKLLYKAKQFLPALDADSGTEWMGFRPSMPDSLPVIGTAKKSDRVVYAFGHGHLGLTQSAGTARLVTDLIEKKPSRIEIEKLSPRRYS